MMLFLVAVGILYNATAVGRCDAPQPFGNAAIA
jgi:hypothetical protein